MDADSRIRPRMDRESGSVEEIMIQYKSVMGC